MNKASFDRKYKAIKGHMMNEVIVMDVNATKERRVVDIHWSDTLQKILIVIE